MFVIRSGFAIVLAAGAVAATAASADAAAPATCDQQIIYQIDSARISTEPDGFLIDAFGVAESAGWSKPTLIVRGSDKTGIVQVDFVACRPEVSAQVLTPIQTRVTLDLDLATTRQIVIRSKTNSMTVEISK
jgi:hypothetical protein